MLILQKRMCIVHWLCTYVYNVNGAYTYANYAKKVHVLYADYVLVYISANPKIIVSKNHVHRIHVEIISKVFFIYSYTKNCTFQA